MPVYYWRQLPYRVQLVLLKMRSDQETPLDLGSTDHGRVRRNIN